MQVSQHFENWDNFVNKCSVCLHAVDGNGTILWANNLELKAMGYEPDEYIGRFIGDSTWIRTSYRTFLPG